MDTRHRDDALNQAVVAAHRVRAAEFTGHDLRGQLLGRGYDVVPTPAEGEPLYGDPAAHDPEELLVQFAEWLDLNRHLDEIPPEVADGLDDLVSHFLTDRREARETAGDD